MIQDRFSSLFALNSTLLPIFNTQVNIFSTHFKDPKTGGGLIREYCIIIHYYNRMFSSLFFFFFMRRHNFDLNIYIDCVKNELDFDKRV